MLILASKSPRRQELLRLITPNFKVVTEETDETTAPELSPQQTVLELALRKARAVAALCPQDTVLGADTVVAIGNRILGKPQSHEEAVEMLTMLSGKTHSVFTGVALVKQGKEEAFCQCTHVTFYPLSPKEIEAYAATQEPYDKAGAYGIQGMGALLIEKIQGDYYNVVGLPVSLLCRKLAEM